jgi:Kef-type K+ transport system membrane component KefB
MNGLTHTEITDIFLALGLLLAGARFFGEVAKRCHQPSVLGEILAGIVLGPTVLGTLAPAWSSMLFPMHGRSAVVLEGFTVLAVVLFLFVAGLEVDLSTIRRQGKTALIVAAAGLAGPFSVGFCAAWYAPRLLGWEGEAALLLFTLFFATALSISALPVIAKTLLDLNLYRSDLGMTVIAAAICDDLAGWLIFAVLLGMMGTHTGHAWGIGVTLGLLAGFALGMLTLGRWIMHHLLGWMEAHTGWPESIMGLVLVLALLSAAFTEHIGVHAIFGAFLVGVAVGDSSHLHEQTRTVLSQFISSILAPLFFASIGLKVNFALHFDGQLVLTVLIIACWGKVVGCGLGARMSGMPSRVAWALGFAMNARGAMEIILGLLALKYGLIHERLFVALVIMALVTSILGGPMMQHILGHKKSRPRAVSLPVEALSPSAAGHHRQEAMSSSH